MLEQPGVVIQLLMELGGVLLDRSVDGLADRRVGQVHDQGDGGPLDDAGYEVRPYPRSVERPEVGREPTVPEHDAKNDKDEGEQPGPLLRIHPPSSFCTADAIH